jgi:hypothetical protein
VSPNPLALQFTNSQASGSLTLTAVGGAVKWTIANVPADLTVSANSGSLTVAGNTATVTVSVAPGAQMINPETLTVTPANPAESPINITVNPPPTIG